MIDSGQDSRSGTGLQLSSSLKLFLKETSAFKQQNPGKVRQRQVTFNLSWWTSFRGVSESILNVNGFLYEKCSNVS